MAHWYTADLHFGHARVIELARRPFSSLSQMHSALIANFQAKVAPDDDLWVIGDFALVPSTEARQVSEWFHALPGRKHLVLGNHDDELAVSLPWNSIHDIAEIQDGKAGVVLCHYPMITWNGARRGTVQLFGHVHERWQGTRNSINVGVDQWDFAPACLAQIKARALRLPPNEHWADVERGTAIR